MRLKNLALALLLGTAIAAPVVAQTTAPTTSTTTPRPTTPAIVAPKPVTPATTPATTAPTTTPSTTTAATPTTGLTNINTASAADLDKLPSIGKARAASIIKNRPYKSVDELTTKKAIPKSVFEKIKALVTI